MFPLWSLTSPLTLELRCDKLETVCKSVCKGCNEVTLAALSCLFSWTVYLKLHADFWSLYLGISTYNIGGMNGNSFFRDIELFVNKQSVTDLFCESLNHHSFSSHNCWAI